MQHTLVMWNIIQTPFLHPFIRQYDLKSSQLMLHYFHFKVSIISSFIPASD
jgi:hypothetical protein